LANASLTSLNLSSNQLCGVWYESGKLTGTYTAEGIKAIADALRVSVSLIKLDVGNNYNMGEGMAALQKTVEGRPASGFELMLYL
jgi:hypothetical protein